MFCPNCGTRTEDYALFCPNCGTRFPQAQGSGAGGYYNGAVPPAGAAQGSGNGSAPMPGRPVPASGQGMPGGKKPNGGSRVLIGVLAALLVLVIAAAATLLILRSRNGSKTAEKDSESGAASVLIESDSEEALSGTEPAGTANADAAAENSAETPAGSAQNGNAGGADSTLPIPVIGGGTDSAAAGGEASAAESAAESAGTESEAPAVRPNIVISTGDEARLIAELNSGSTEANSIDIYAENYQAGARNTDLAWDNSLFYRLEDVYPDRYDDGQINGYLVTRKSFVNAQNGNKIEYEIYTQPSTGYVEKIVSIEYMPEHLEITDYYYKHNGDDVKVNFVFRKNDVNYIPSYAQPTTDGQRYYFNADNMVKMRIVSGGTITNYCLGANSAAENSQGSETLVSSLSEADRNHYYEEEVRELNAAYNTYYTVLGAQGISWISGYVYDAEGSARLDADVYLCSGQEYLYRCSPDAEGLYSIAVPEENKVYELFITAPDCTDTRVYDVEVAENVLSSYITAVYMMVPGTEKYQQTLMIRDALNYAANGTSMMPVDGAQVNIRAGVGARNGEVLETGVSDGSGDLVVSLLPGMYTAEVIKSGYDVLYVTFAVRVNMASTEIHFSPTLPEGEMRIVLSWGETPRDLDSHLFTPYDSTYGNSGYHIYYSNKTDALGDNLDVDDTDSFGPETITIPVVRNGLYKYYVVDYTNCSANNPTSYAMSNSGATVNVYGSGGLVATFHVPENTSGVIWEVFEIRNGQIIPNQRYYNSISGTNWWYRD